MGRGASTTEATPAATPPPDGGAPTGPRSGWLGLVVVAAIALALGIGGTMLLTGARTADPPLNTRDAAAPDRTATVDPEALAGAGFENLPAPPSGVPEPPATDPIGAVVGFLTAEAAADFERSFDFLSADARAAFGGTSASWIAVHADVMPPVTGFVIGEVTSFGDGRTAVASTVGFRPSLDEVVGLVPPQAQVTWMVVEADDGTFGVDLEVSAFSPLYVSDATASDAVAAWVTSRQACGRDGEWGGTLLGVVGPVRALCGASGQITVGEPAALSSFEAAPFTAAFGEDVLAWARQIEVTGAVELRAVIAPIGTEWRVIGALPPAPGD